MKTPTLNVGILNVPNSHPKVTLYSDTEAEKNFKKMNQDIYNGYKKQNFYSDKKTPPAIWVGLGLLGTFGIYKFIKLILKK